MGIASSELYTNQDVDYVFKIQHSPKPVSNRRALLTASSSSFGDGPRMQNSGRLKRVHPEASRENLHRAPTSNNGQLERASSGGKRSEKRSPHLNASGRKTLDPNVTEARKQALKQKIMQSRKLMGAVTAFQEEGNRLYVQRRAAQNHRYPWLLKDVKITPGISTDHFDFDRVLGNGLFGHVWLARFKRFQGYVALKQMGKTTIVSSIHRIRQEREAMLDLKCHPFIAHLFGTFQTETDIYFVMEYLPGGELFTRLIRSKNQRFPIEIAKFYACEVLLALEHIHEKGYIYRDLKPENIVIDEEGHIRIVDFGFARTLENGKCTSVVGTPAYQSPEQLNAKTNGGYTQAVDWWAFACLIYEMLFSRTPFEGKHRSESPYQIYTRVMKAKVKFPRRFPSHLKETLKSMFEVDLKKRLCTPQDIKMSPFFSRVDWFAVEDCRIVPPFVPELLLEADAHYFYECPRPAQSPYPHDQTIFHGF